MTYDGRTQINMYKSANFGNRRSEIDCRTHLDFFEATVTTLIIGDPKIGVPMVQVTLHR